VLTMSTSLAVTTYTAILQATVTATATANPSGLSQNSKLGIGIGLGLGLGIGLPLALITCFQACCQAERNTRRQFSQPASV